MKHHLIFSFLFAICIGTLPGQSTFDPDQELDILTMKKGHGGLAAGYSVDGKVAWSGASGQTCQDSNTPFTEKSLTRIASISKSMTAVAVLQLAERSLLALDTPIRHYLPNLSEKPIGDITVRQLLTHTSGISQYRNDREIENSIHYGNLEEAMEVFIDRPLLFAPGTKYFYSTYGYVILGRIIEVVSGLRYEDYMQREIFQKAGMTHTGVEDIHGSYENKSCLYHKNGRKTKPGKQNDLSNRIPGGGFYSTLEDVINFGIALLDGKLISEASLELMRTPLPVAYDGNKYGMGWFLYGPAPHENVVIGHSGGQTGCTSQLMIVPASRTVVVVLSNTSGTYPEIATLASNLIAWSESRKSPEREKIGH